MSLIRYQAPVFSAWPAFNRLATFQNEIDQLFGLTTGAASGPAAWAPPLDLFEDEDNFTVSVELPGFKKEDISLSLHDGILTVSGERKHVSENNASGSFRSERFYGKFERSVTLPSQVRSDAVKASYKDGVLAVTLPKAEEAKPRQIQVSVD